MPCDLRETLPRFTSISDPEHERLLRRHFRIRKCYALGGVSFHSSFADQRIKLALSCMTNGHPDTALAFRTEHFCVLNIFSSIAPFSSDRQEFVMHSPASWWSNRRLIG